MTGKSRLNQYEILHIAMSVLVTAQNPRTLRAYAGDPWMMEPEAGGTRTHEVLRMWLVLPLQEG